MTEQPAWLAAAWGEFGVREAAGSASSKRVLGYFKEAGHRVSDDATPWCAAFAGAMLKRAGLAGTKSLRARSYLTWGVAIGTPQIGAITVLTRGADPNAGHVGFYLGAAQDRVFLLGGNQSDGVTVEAFDAARVLGHRWPKIVEAREETSDADVFDAALRHVLEMEGGFTDDPHDPGGPTNRGITLAVFARWKGVTIDALSRARLVSELKRIPDDVVRGIYAARYWEPSRCALFTAPLALMHFDASVNHGVSGAARLLQTAVGVTVDGEIGPETLKAIAVRTAGDLLDAYADVRRRRYQALPHFWRFGRGWLRRVDATLTAARLMTGEGGETGALKASARGAKGDATMDDGRVTTTIETQPEAKWWGQSRTIWGTLITAAATVLPLIGPLIGFEIPGDVVKEAGEQTVTAVQAIAGLFGTLLALYGRVKGGAPLARKSVSVRL